MDNNKIFLPANTELKAIIIKNEMANKYLIGAIFVCFPFVPKIFKLVHLSQIASFNVTVKLMGNIKYLNCIHKNLAKGNYC